MARWVVALLLLVAAAAAVVERDDLSVLHTVHADYAIEGEVWEHALLLAREAVRAGHTADEAVGVFGDVLTPTIEYVYHGRGVCVGIEQVVSCLLDEETLRMQQRGDARVGRSVQQSSVRKGAMHVVRVLDAANDDSVRLLDVYFVRLDAAGRAAHVEHLPTVRNPLAFTWRAAPAAA